MWPLALPSFHFKCCKPFSWTKQQKLHTEGKVLDETASSTKAGDILIIQGTNPACNMGKGAMNEAAKERSISIGYKDASSKTWKGQ